LVLVEGLNAGLGPTGNQRMTVESAFMDIDRFKIHDAPNDVILVRYTLAAMNVASQPDNLKRFSAIVLLDIPPKSRRG
jgi:hypothetical protein